MASVKQQIRRDKGRPQAGRAVIVSLPHGSRRRFASSATSRAPSAVLLTLSKLTLPLLLRLYASQIPSRVQCLADVDGSCCPLLNCVTSVRRQEVSEQVGCMLFGGPAD